MSTQLFLWATWGCAGLAAILLIVTVILWGRQSEWRFAFVGYTAFSVVLMVGCFALTLTPITRTAVPGALPYTTVYDQGAEQAVIAVTPTITPEQLTLTLQQAANNLFSSGRFSQGSPQLTIRARTVVHSAPDRSEPIYLGKIEQRLGQREDSQRRVEIFATGFDQLDHIRSHSKQS